MTDPNLNAANKPSYLHVVKTVESMLAGIKTLDDPARAERALLSVCGRILYSVGRGKSDAWKEEILSELDDMLQNSPEI